VLDEAAAFFAGVATAAGGAVVLSNSPTMRLWVFIDQPRKGAAFSLVVNCQ